MSDITIIKKVRCAKDLHTGRLYYFEGNFFYPLDLLNKKEEKRIAKAIRLFCYKNKQMILKDRANPNYVSKEQLE